MKKLSTTALAKLHKLPVNELFAQFETLGLIAKEENKWRLTNRGKEAGGEYKSFEKNGESIEYIAWSENMQLETQERKQEQKKLLSSTDMGRHFDLSSRRINSVLNEIGLIKKALKGWKITKLGSSIGGVEKEHPKSGVPYVVWSDSILDHASLIKTIHEVKGETTQSQAQKGSDFRKKFEANYRTTDGHYVRSKAEMLIDNWLYMAEIIHAYERKLPIEEELYCDFYLPSGKVYIEYWGIEDDPKYAKRKEAKRAIYKKYNFKLIELNDEDVANLDDVLPRLLLKFDIQAY
ncbi:MAG: glycerol kinase [Campylobacterota bacterium]|nr:glycerol kinase [Campylobacterota bacterium]